MGNEPQILMEVLLWVLILLAALGGASGEMQRAGKAGLGDQALLRRLALYSSAPVVYDVTVMLLVLACGATLLLAAVLDSLTVAVGTEVAVGFHEHWVAWRLGGYGLPKGEPHERT